MAKALSDCNPEDPETEEKFKQRAICRTSLFAEVKHVTERKGNLEEPVTYITTCRDYFAG
jgi:hypothetical protein